MTQTIDLSRIRPLAEAKGIRSAKELARRLGLKPGQNGEVNRTVYRLWSGRLEKGKQHLRLRAVSLEKLAAVLGVDVAVLTGEAPMPAPDEDAEPSAADGVSTLKVRINAAAYNALVSNEMRYRVPVRTQVELAALLFHVVAQRSLRHRRDALEKIETTLEALRVLGRDAAPHLMSPAAQSVDAEAALNDEHESIEAEDLLAERSYSAGGWDKPNPLALEVSRLALVLPEDERAVGVEKEEVDYRINRPQAMAIAGGDEELAAAVLDGRVSLEGMRNLLAEERRDDRVAELRRRLQAYKPLRIEDFL
jgi:transcriptional regulator with XRE-family HTH domain